MLGIPSEEIAIDWNEVIFKGLHIKGIYGREMYETWYSMTAMLQTGLDISDGDHPPHALHRIRRRLRCDEPRRVCQGRAGMGLDSSEWSPETLRVCPCY